ncbi:MAG: family 16 glycoside hydrolase [Thermoguttaceae bacterium]
MKSALSLTVILLLTLGARAAEKSEWNFEDGRQDRLPQGWSAIKTGDGPGCQWRIVLDQDSPAGPKVLAQVSADGPRPFFNLCVAEQASFRDLDLVVHFKAVEGKIDQGGGPVWRLRDADNYYVARMNPLEDNFRVYKVEDGKRTQLGSADVKVPAGQWHRIRIVHVGNRIRCFLDDHLHLDVTDQAFPDAGKVGLWTKADAVTRFDGLSAMEKSRPE